METLFEAVININLQTSPEKSEPAIDSFWVIFHSLFNLLLRVHVYGFRQPSYHA
jgi:hypothetical protein